MKRKVKFQEGGAVEGPSPRNQQLRDAMDEARRVERGRRMGQAQDAVRQFNQMPEVQSANERDTRNRTRVGLAERARERERARQAAIREQAASRAASQADVARFNDRMNRAMPISPEQARGLGAEPRPSVSERLRADAMRPPTSGPAAAQARSRLGGGAVGTALGLLPLALEGGAALVGRSRGSAVGEGDEYGLNEQPPPAPVQAAPPAMDRLANTDQMRPTPAASPAPRPRPRPQARPQGRRELTADELNSMVLERLGAERGIDRAEGPAAAVARERIAARMAEPYKKGGMVKPKTAPKKMMKGGVVAKPKVAAKKGKPMPAFKKGGKVAMKKGKK